MKLVTTLLLAATCSAFALDDGPILACDREMVRWLHGDLAKARCRKAEADFQASLPWLAPDMCVTVPVRLMEIADPRFP